MVACRATTGCAPSLLNIRGQTCDLARIARQASCELNRLRAICGTQFAQDLGHVRLDRRLRDLKILSDLLVSGVNDTTSFIFALAAFAAGFAVRPFGALVFGRLGDLVGRKHTFLITMSIMGGATFAVGLLPSYATAGVAAPVLLVVLRLLQGLALGGEYGGAATYVAEHAPPGKRGFFTSWIQTTATLGLFAALLVVIGTRTYVGEDAFKV
jgi:hypothetical protein